MDEIMMRLDEINKKLDAILAEAPKKRKLLTTKEASEYFGIKIDTIYGWVRDGKIPVRRVGNAGKILIDPREVDKVMKKGVRE